jgi:hypothetical protein
MGKPVANAGGTKGADAERFHRGHEIGIRALVRIEFHICDFRRRVHVRARDTGELAKCILDDVQGARAAYHVFEQHCGELACHGSLTFVTLVMCGGFLRMN